MHGDGFRAAWWLPGPHGQTLGARLLRSRSGVRLRRERLELPDGDFVDLDWVAGVGAFRALEAHPLVLVLHGLEGSARSGYALQLYRALAARGVAAVGLNFRSCSGEPNRLPRAYHSGDTGDIDAALKLLVERYPDRPVGACGFSLGGNALLKYLGEQGSRGQPPLVRAAAAVSVPYELSAGADHVERGFSRVYRAFLVRRLRNKIRAKAALLESLIDVDRTLRTRTFREFDELATAPLNGFASAEDYYRKSSAAAFLSAISTPTLLIHALDDPFLPPTLVPRELAGSNPHIETVFTARGGHVGFVTGPPWAPVYWAEERAASFLAAGLAGTVSESPTHDPAKDAGAAT